MLFVLTAFVILGVAIISQVNSQVEATNKRVWGEPVYGEWSGCEVKSDQCGLVEGYQSRSVTKTCEQGRGEEHECEIEKSCPDGYTPGIQNKCWKCTGSFKGFCYQWDSKPYIYTPEVSLDYEHQSCELAEEDVIQCGTNPYCLDGETIYVPTNEEAPEGAVYSTCPGNPVPAQTFTHPSTTTAWHCPNSDLQEVPVNPHVVRNGSFATVKWFWPAVGDQANIYFGENGNGYEHSVRDIPRSGEFQEVTINNLNPVLGYTFAIELKNGCGGGVKSVIVDPPSYGETFMFSHYEV